MRNAMIFGVCFIVLGLMMSVNGYQAAPRRWLLVGAGVMFIVSGILRMVLPRRSGVPVA